MDVETLAIDLRAVFYGKDKTGGSWVNLRFESQQLWRAVARRVLDLAAQGKLKEPAR